MIANDSKEEKLNEFGHEGNILHRCRNHLAVPPVHGVIVCIELFLLGTVSVLTLCCKEREVIFMLFLFGLALCIPGCAFGIRFISEHKFEYLDGVKPSEQLDRNFWISMGLMCPGLVFMLIGLL